MAQARSPAVALVVIRCVADAQEVRLVKPGKLLVGIDVALDQQRDSALPGGAVKFVLVVKRSKRIRGCREGRSNVVDHVVFAPNRLRGDEAAQRHLRPFRWRRRWRALGNHGPATAASTGKGE